MSTAVGVQMAAGAAGVGEGDIPAERGWTIMSHAAARPGDIGTDASG